MAKGDLTLGRVREVLDYSPETGEFRWRVRLSFRIPRVGAPADQPVSGGYLRITVDQRHYRAHRLAWFYIHGIWPAAEIDHINGIKTDNRIDNLREVGRHENMHNLPRPRADNKLQVRGVAERASGRFSAKIRIDGRNVGIGTFDTAEEAGIAYLDAKRRHHAGFIG